MEKKTIELSYSRWKRVESLLEQAVTPEMVDEKNAAQLLGFSTVKTMQKRVSDKTIPMDWYTVNALGKRFYFKRKILGL